MPTPDQSILFELADLLNERAIARYQDQIQDAYDRERDPIKPNPLGLEHEFVANSGEEYSS